MASEDPPKVRAVQEQVDAILEAFERLIDMGVPAMRIDLIIDHLRNKYGYKSRTK